MYVLYVMEEMSLVRYKFLELRSGSKICVLDKILNDKFFIRVFLFWGDFLIK